MSRVSTTKTLSQSRAHNQFDIRSDKVRLSEEKMYYMEIRKRVDENTVYCERDS